MNSLCILQWNSGGLSSYHSAELCYFLSSNWYDLMLLEATISPAPTLKFQASLSSELIAPLPAEAQLLLEIRTMGEFSL